MSCSLFHFSLSSGRVRLLLRLSCLSLVIVPCSPVSFFSLWVRLFYLFCLYCLSSASLLSLVFPFGSPGVCFLFFAVCSGLLCLLYTLRCPFFTAVALPCTSSGFPVSLLACSVLLPHSREVVFIAVCVFASASTSFSPVRLLRLGFRSLHSLVGCSDVSSPPVTVLFWILASPFSFLSFPPCLPFFPWFRFHSSVFFLPIHSLFYWPGCRYMRFSLFFFPFRLV